MVSTADGSGRFAGDVLVVGAGRVGRALARALSARGVAARVVPARTVGARAVAGAKHLVLAVRDPDLAAVERRVAPDLVRGSVVIHCAGRFGPEVLSACKAQGASVGQMHPLLSFAGAVPNFDGATFLVRGDRRAVRVGGAIARLLGAVPRSLPGVDAGAYHAAAAIFANGLVALAAGYVRVLGPARVPDRVAMALIAPLGASVLENLRGSTPARALTGPVRRGDVEAVEALLGRASADPATLLAVRGLLGLQIELTQGRGGLPRRQRAALARLLAAAEAPLARERAPSTFARSRALARG